METHLRRSIEGGGGRGGNDGLTRDFLGLRTISHRGFPNMAGLDHMNSPSSSYDQQNQNQTPWQVYSQCLEDQRSLLLQLKNSLKFNLAISVRLVNWTPSKDCCGWKGVTCDQVGHVTSLDLNSKSISGGIDLSSSLFSLQFLESLNLDNNNFSWKQIPSSFGNLISLKYLNLSNAGFSGQIPIEFSHLKSLSNCDLSGPIDSSLRTTSLSEIHLDSNNLSVSVLEFFANFTNLTVLSLSSSNLEGQFPPKIFQVLMPQTLDLSNNKKLQGSLPKFLQNGSLQRIVLSDTNFSGRLPDSIGNLRNLSRIDLSDCNFAGPIPSSMANLGHLVYLDLSSNNFIGPIPTFRPLKSCKCRFSI
ncbi:hypothetical protein ACSBR1_018432 [Camellia fascicularis]